MRILKTFLFIISTTLLGGVLVAQTTSEIFWLKPTNLSPNALAKVENWQSSGTDVSAEQPNPASQPAYNTNLFNGHPGLDMDGAQFLELPSDIDFISENKTFIAVYRPDEATYSIVSKGRAVSGDAQNGDFS